MLPWVAADHDVDGYIRWAWNLWPTDVWTQPKFKWPPGDMFFVYPGDTGPLDSTRWEMLHQGIQDVEALRLLVEKAQGQARANEIEKEVGKLRKEATRIHGCRGTSSIRDQRKRINQLISEL
jgi:hypothetical protein